MISEFKAGAKICQSVLMRVQRRLTGGQQRQNTVYYF